MTVPARKVRAHLRVSYDKKRREHRIQVNVKPNHAPLTNSRGEFLPTVSFALDLEIPDAVFVRAERVIATVTVPEDALAIAADVKSHVG